VVIVLNYEPKFALENQPEHDRNRQNRDESADDDYGGGEAGVLTVFFRKHEINVPLGDG